jgi:hypothetical protein
MLIDDWRALRHAPPGRRFQEHHRRKHKGPIKALAIFAGMLLVVAGVLAGFVPGVPGFVLIMIGAAMLSSQSKAVARALDRAEVRVRAFLRRS